VSHIATVARAVAWNVVTGVGAKIIGLVGTLILARFITPNDYGEVSTALICVATAAQLTNPQFGQYIIVRGYREPGLAFHAAFYHVLFGWTAIAGAFLARDALAPWLGAPGMGRYMGGLAVAAAIDLLAIVPEKELARDFRFRLIASTRGLGEVLYAVLAVSFVPRLGGTAIVIGVLGRSILLMVVFFFAADRQWLRPVRLSRLTSGALFKYSSPLALANMTDFATTRWDNLLVSRFHGAGVMGNYNLAYNLSQTSTLSIVEHIADVLFPSFARLEPKNRGQALVRAVSTMGMVVFPLAFGLAAVAGSVVGAFFKPQWAMLAPMLTVLSVHAAAEPLSWTFRAFYKAQDRTRFVMTAGILRLAVMLGGLVVIGRWGPLWACVAVDLAFLAHVALMWSGLRRDHAGLMRPIATGLGRVLLACVPMVAGVLAVRALLDHVGPVSHLLALLLEVPAGAAAFVAGALIFARPALVELAGLLAGLVRKTRASSTPDTEVPA
jgi:lipopolysaccharide exporter